MHLHPEFSNTEISMFDEYQLPEVLVNQSVDVLYIDDDYDPTYLVIKITKTQQQVLIKARSSWDEGVLRFKLLSPKDEEYISE